MSISNKMMNVMVGRMSPQKKQEMMTTMMPMMMEGVNMADTMVKMVPVMMDQITLMDLVQLVKDLGPKVVQFMDMMVELAPNMAEAMPKMVTKMPGIMDKMMPIMMENDTLRKMMPQMMTAMMPHCFRNMLQHLPAEEKASFISEIESLLADVKSGDS